MALSRRAVPGWLLLLACAPVRADAPAPPADAPCAVLAEAPPAERALDAGALASCLDALAASSGDDPAVRGSLEQARLALERARALRSGDAASRALRIARAALLFADRTLALERARRVSREGPR